MVTTGNLGRWKLKRRCTDILTFDVSIWIQTHVNGVRRSVRSNVIRQKHKCPEARTNKYTPLYGY
jgi:hypothetical protein